MSKKYSQKVAFILYAGIITGMANSAHAVVMDFETELVDITTAAFTQNGLTLTPIDSGVGTNHWDLNLSGQFGATTEDFSAGIHRGNNGEKVDFTYFNGSFDLLSIDIEVVYSDLFVSVTEGTIQASSGATHTVSNRGTIDFTSLAGWSGITSFSFFMPSGSANCNDAGVDCPGIVFDNVVFQEHVVSQVPVPAAVWLFASGVLGLARLNRVARYS